MSLAKEQREQGKALPLTPLTAPFYSKENKGPSYKSLYAGSTNIAVGLVCTLNFVCIYVYMYISYINTYTSPL
jgi:hypothetical protein